MADKVGVTLPEGMTEADFMKSFETWQKQRISTQVRDKAVRSATKDLVEKHKPEYETILAKYMPK